MTLGEWLDRWCAVYKAPKLKPASFATLQTVIRLHIPEDLRAVKLRRLRALALQEVINAVKLSRTRLYTYEILNEALRKAYSLRLMRREIMRKVEAPIHVQKQGRALTRDEQAALFERLQGHKLRPLILFYLYTGCRRSEALSLTFADLDTQAGTLSIRGTKTRTSDRVLPLFPQVAEIVAAQPPGETVFPFSPCYVTHAFKQLCPAHKLHDLRHTFATRCLECGINIRVVQQWLGHARLETTAGLYTHVLDDFQRQEAAKFRL